MYQGGLQVGFGQWALGASGAIYSNYKQAGFFGQFAAPSDDASPRHGDLQKDRRNLEAYPPPCGPPNELRKLRMGAAAPIIIGISGVSRAAYGIRLLEGLQSGGIRAHLDRKARAEARTGRGSWRISGSGTCGASVGKLKPSCWR